MDVRAAIAPTPAPPERQTSINLLEDNNKTISAKLGHKLSFKEKIGFSLLRGKLKKAERKKAKGQEYGRDGLPIASLILGILSILGFGLFLFPALLAVIFGAVSLKRNRYVDPPRYNMAIWGIVLGGISLLLTLTIVYLLILIF